MFSSCPGIFKISGIVISNKTGAAIEGAKIEVSDVYRPAHFDASRDPDVESFLSDKNGDFNASLVMRRMRFGLPEYRIRIIKSGYQILKIKINLQDNKILIYLN